VFSQEWYARVKRVLAPQGIAALNAVSPERTPEAFWCLRRTIRAAGLSALPFRVPIPSFRAHGYGVWAFFLAAHGSLRQTNLDTLACPIPTRQADLTRLRRGAHWARKERQWENQVPVNTLANGCLLPLLLNPGQSQSREFAPLESNAPYNLDALLRAIPISHPSHTRLMVETLAAQVAGTVRALDIECLVEALIKRARELPRALRRELRRLRIALRDKLPSFDVWATWGYRLFAALVIVLTLANSLAPDTAFAKGAMGLGHAGISRGIGSFGRAGSFGGTHGFEAETHVTGGGFRRSYGHTEATDIYGNSYRPRVFYYRGYGGGHGYFGNSYGGSTGTGAAPAPSSHQSLFVAEDDLVVLDNGDVVITLSDHVYLLASGGQLGLLSDTQPDPLLMLYPDPDLFDNIRAHLQAEQAVARRESAARRDWLSWTGWTQALFPAVAEDRAELRNLDDLSRRLDAALANLGQPPADANPLTPPPADQVELFVGGVLLPNDQVALRGADGHWLYTDGKHLWRDKAEGQGTPIAPPLAAALRGVMAKLQKEFLADKASDDHDLQGLASDRASLQRDLAEYQSLYASNGYDGTYEVDYGTDEIPVADALARTRTDLDQNARDTQQTQTERDKLGMDVVQLATAMERFGQ
jgi:hypothetical protein